VRIVVCDDHRLLVEVITAAIVKAGHTVAAIASTPAEALAAVERHRPDVLLLDLMFPHGDSLETARTVVARYPRTRTVVLTGSESLGPLEEAMAIGVAGYLSKDQQIEHMLALLERCIRGEQVIDEVLMRRLDRAVRERRQKLAALSELTAREREVADLLRAGLSTTHMAAKLGVSETTVRSHVQGILNKLGVHSRVEAVAVLDGRSPRPSRAVS
jgi:two-component system nitrate/nitrite response regulator NarL